MKILILVLVTYIVSLVTYMGVRGHLWLGLIMGAVDLVAAFVAAVVWHYKTRPIQ